MGRHSRHGVSPCPGSPETRDGAYPEEGPISPLLGGLIDVTVGEPPEADVAARGAGAHGVGTYQALDSLS